MALLQNVTKEGSEDHGKTIWNTDQTESEADTGEVVPVHLDNKGSYNDVQDNSGLPLTNEQLPICEDKNNTCRRSNNTKSDIDINDGPINCDNRASHSTLSELPIENDQLPIDRGWAWMILAGSLLNVILLVGYGKSVGILFVEYLKEFQDSATKTTLFIGVMKAVFSLSSLFSMNLLLQIIGVRKLVLLGGTIIAFGMLTAVFATSITFLICTHSVLIGIGQSMIQGPGLVLIGQYFKKRHGFATVVSMSGISLSGSVFPALIQYFIGEYGVRGSMLLLTGITLNMWVGALLYRPLESFQKAPVKQIYVPNDEAYVDVTDNENTKSSDHLNVSLLYSGCDDTDTEDNVLSDLHENCISETTTESQSETGNVKSGSDSMLGVTILRSHSDNGNTVNKKSNTICYYLKTIVTSLDFSLFRNPMFQLIIIISNFGIIFGLSAVYLPALATEKGVVAMQVPLLLTICGITEFFCRLGFGYVADLRYIKVSHLMVIGMVLSGTVIHFTAFYNSYALLIMFSVLTGLFGGFYQCLVPVYIVDCMGRENMAKVLGFVTVFHGLATSVTHPIMGAIRDISGSYNICYNYIGMCNYIAAICLFSEPLARRRLDIFNARSASQSNGSLRANGSFHSA